MPPFHLARSTSPADDTDPASARRKPMLRLRDRQPRACGGTASDGLHAKPGASDRRANRELDNCSRRPAEQPPWVEPCPSDLDRICPLTPRLAHCGALRRASLSEPTAGTQPCRRDPLHTPHLPFPDTRRDRLNWAGSIPSPRPARIAGSKPFFRSRCSGLQPKLFRSAIPPRNPLALSIRRPTTSMKLHADIALDIPTAVPRRSTHGPRLNGGPRNRRPRRSRAWAAASLPASMPRSGKTWRQRT